MASEEQILKSIKSRDKQVLELVVDKHCLLLWKICQKSQNDPLVSERLVTEVFQQLWQNPEKFTGEKKLLLLLILCCKEKIAELGNETKNHFSKDESDSSQK
ncbi:hypothetical protein KQ939_07970 [Planococcus sp. CP5-4]|uniref:RNA polymerase sigma factor n=1 Tax=unclassified Planococcus (in: firmicutes) TaxID=2662419 RepID=UPI001C24D8D8|nr:MULTISPECIES: hypothetical protein [unclassified Planococcus (in: firmicutes)]MBU9671837.1 hypothetical protein [Planococcus sp. CP5-4_YE]MBV0909157.1 hypothetical protein [Planococcus sp. CP5-4_UN]MBW6063649.1 hypothetical protein [Planococcus sp. CP5-4]